MKNKVVVITGASSGIGKALAYEFAGKGAKVVIGARNHEKLIEIAEEIKLDGGDVAFAQTDVSVESDCKNLIITAVERFGKIDVLINNAGISMRALFQDVEFSVLKELMAVNFWGAVYCSKYALPQLVKQKGSLVAVSSIAGLKGLPGRTGYSASKFALQGFMESVRIENLKKGLHVLVTHPGFTTSNIRQTSRNKDGEYQGESPRNEDKMMSAEEVAGYIYMAVKNRKYNLVLTAQGRLTVLINKILPRWLDKMIYKEMAKEPDSPFK